MSAIPQMNNTSSNILDSMPSNARDKAIWCNKTFGTIIEGHIRHLKRFKILPKEDQWLSYNGVFENGFTKVQYWSLLIEFPYNRANLKQSEWLSSFDIIVDNSVVILDTGISTVPDTVRNTGKKTSSVLGKLLSPLIPVSNRPIHIQAKRFIRIQPKV